MDDKDKRRKDFFDIINELIKDINKMMKDLMEGNMDEDLSQPNFKGFSIYMGPEGIDVRDLSGRPISSNWDIKGIRDDSREFLRLDYDIVDEDGEKIIYIDLRRVPSSDIKVEKEAYILRIISKNRVFSAVLPKDLSEYSIKSHEIKNGVLKVVLRKKKGFFRF